VRDQSPDDRAWVLAKKKPVTCETRIGPAGLIEAVEEVAACVQRELHERESPLDMLVAPELWHTRLWYLTALIYRKGNQLAKEIEARASLDGHALAICIGSAKYERVDVYIHGRLQQIEMPGYVGCLRTFPDPPYGPGRRWPRVCPECRSRRSNARNKAVSDLRRRAAAVGRTELARNLA
jgi:hypothetical protein